MTMSKGEKAELTVEPEWGYGKKGNINAGYPLITETDKYRIEEFTLTLNTLYVFLT